MARPKTEKTDKDKEKKYENICPPDRFVEIWQASASTEEVCEKIVDAGFYPSSRTSVLLRAALYRKRGVTSLKRMASERGRKKIDMVELEKIAKKAARAAAA